MDNRGKKLNNLGEPGDYIWLRYGTQLSVNGRSYTIEMNVPMPIGASEETREQLLREADAGMGQVAEHVENRVAQLLQRVQAQGKVPSPAATTRPVPSVPPTPQPRPASQPAPQTGPHPLQPAGRARENTGETTPFTQPIQKEAVSVPPPRHIGASMPSTPAMGDNSNLSLQQFISYIRENMGINPKQAMDLLKIKTLTGVNLRDAVEQLQKLVGPGAAATSEATSRERETASTATTPTRQNSGPLSSTPTKATEATKTSTQERSRKVNEEERAYTAFDEEVEPEESNDLEDELEDFDFSRDLTAQERVQARNKIDSLREHRGATQSNTSRQQVLLNVVDSQITSQQLQDLITGVWNVTSIKKLKVDQVEALISWAKQDDFVSEVEAVLIILEED